MLRGLGSTPTPPFPSPPRWQSVVSHAALACGGEGQLICARTRGRRSRVHAGTRSLALGYTRWPLQGQKPLSVQYCSIPGVQRLMGKSQPARRGSQRVGLDRFSSRQTEVACYKYLVPTKFENWSKSNLHLRSSVLICVPVSLRLRVSAAAFYNCSPGSSLPFLSEQKL
jgi:hypothetical protein